MTRLLTVVLVLVCAGVASAQIDPHPDGIGLYFDTGAMQVCAQVETFTPYSLHLCLTRPSSPNGVSGWECRLEYPGNQIALSPDIGAQSRNLLTGSDFLVAPMAPLPAADVVVLCTIEFLATDGFAGSFHVRPLDRPSLVGGACYADGADPRLLIPLHPSSGSWDLPVAQVNGDCGVTATEPSAWGRVKALYGAVEQEVTP